jgi:hypothetical protein
LTIRLTRRLLVAGIAALALTTLVAARRRVVSPAPARPTIDIRRSLVVTDTDILSAFDFERVLRTLTDRSGTRSAMG